MRTQRANILPTPQLLTVSKVHRHYPIDTTPRLLATPRDGLIPRYYSRIRLTISKSKITAKTQGARAHHRVVVRVSPVDLKPLAASVSPYTYGGA
jgi:hypothetical protein